MPSAITAVFGANSTSFRRELEQMQRIASQTGATINKGLSGHTGGGSSGILTEITVMIREFSRGNFSRLPGSLSILANRMGALKYIVKDNASAATLLADAWEKLAQKASLAAIASTRKAQASHAAFFAEGGETEANFEAAEMDEAKAKADILVARTTQAKAVASAEAAAAANLEAGATRSSVSVLGVAIGVIAALGAGAYAANKLVRGLTETLSGVKAPELSPEHIVSRLSRQNSAVEIQREINDEISKSIDRYNSAAEAAARVTTATKEHFKNQRELLNYQKEADMARANTPAKKLAVEKEYSDKELAINAAERAENITNMETERGNLRKESDKKAKEATRIAGAVGPAQADDNVIKMAETKLETIKAAEAAIQKSKDDPGFLNTVSGRDVFRAYNAVAATGVSGKDLDKAEAQVTADRIAAEKEVNRLKDKKDADDLLRTKAKDLTQQAGTAAGKAEDLNSQIADQKKIDATATDADKAAAVAKLNALQAEADRDRKAQERGGGFNLNSNQKIGAYASAPPDWTAALQNIKAIAEHTKSLKGPAHPPVGKGEKHFGGVHQ